MFQQMSPSPYSPIQNDAKSVAEKWRSGIWRELRDLTARMLEYHREQDWTQALAAIEVCRNASEPFGISALFDMYATHRGLPARSAAAGLERRLRGREQIASTGSGACAPSREQKR